MGCWQNLADPNTWTSTALQALKQLHEHLLQHYHCKEWVPPPNANAPAPGAPELDDNARPLSLPPLNLLASLRVRQDVENGDANARPSLPMQRRVTKQIMREWDRHKNALRNPPTERMRDVHQLHIRGRETTASLLLTCRVRVGSDGARLDFRGPNCAHNRARHTVGLRCFLPSVLRDHQQSSTRSFRKCAMRLPEVLYGRGGRMGSRQYMPCLFFKLDSRAQSRLDGAREHLQ